MAFRIKFTLADSSYIKVFENVSNRWNVRAALRSPISASISPVFRQIPVIDSLYLIFYQCCMKTSKIVILKYLVMSLKQRILDSLDAYHREPFNGNV